MTQVISDERLREILAGCEGVTPGPWLDPCPRCGFRASCDCTVLERARAAHPALVLSETKQ